MHHKPTQSEKYYEFPEFVNANTMQKLTAPITDMKLYEARANITNHLKRAIIDSINAQNFNKTIEVRLEQLTCRQIMTLNTELVERGFKLTYLIDNKLCNFEDIDPIGIMPRQLTVMW